MAIIRNSASALRRGRIGNTTYYVSGQRQIARVSQNSSNYGETARRTEAMQERRARWGNLVNIYKLSKGWMKYAYETKTAKQSDYNRFMQVNLNESPIYLTKEEASLGACVVFPYAISQGSLRSISVTRSGLIFTTDIDLGDLELDSNTTVGAFSSQVIALNNGIAVGYQLSFVSYQQYTDDFGIPQVTCTAYEVTLDTSSEAKLRDYLPEFCSTSRNGKLATSNSISPGGFAYIWSVTEGGRTRVSTQSIINNNLMLIAQYSAREQRDLAIQSYGLDTESFLMSGSTPQVPTPGTQAISRVNATGLGYWTPGESCGYTITQFVEVPAVFTMQRNVSATNLAAYLVPKTGAVVPSATATLTSSKEISVTWATSVNASLIDELRLDIDGVRYTMKLNLASAQNED